MWRVALKHNQTSIPTPNTKAKNVLHLYLAAEDFTDDAPLFGDGSPVDLDSLDALQICVALQQYFQVRLQGDRMVRKHMMCVRDLAAFVRAEHGA